MLLHQCLEKIEKMVRQGENDAGKIEDMANKMLASGPDMQVDYVSICDPESLEQVSVIQGKVLCALAVWLGKTRLIDNRVIFP